MSQKSQVGKSRASQGRSSQGASQRTSQGASQRNSQGASQRTSQGASQRNSQGASQRNNQANAAVDESIVLTAVKAVNFLLAHVGAHDTPIKHTDLKKFAFQDMRVDEPLKLARKMLNDTFGYDLQEVPGKTKTYIIVNKLAGRDHISLPKSSEGYRILLSLVLGYIFMSRQEVEEKNLKKFLQQMGIPPTGIHPFFGDVNELLFKSNNPVYVRDQFLYLNSTDQGNFYTWGERANLEVDRRTVLEFVCELLNSDPNDWKLHLKDCEQEEDMDAEE